MKNLGCAIVKLLPFLGSAEKDEKDHSTAQAVQKAEGYRIWPEGCPNTAMHSTLFFPPQPHI